MLDIVVDVSLGLILPCVFFIFYFSLHSVRGAVGSIQALVSDSFIYRSAAPWGPYIFQVPFLGTVSSVGSTERLGQKEVMLRRDRGG